MQSESSPQAKFSPSSVARGTQELASGLPRVEKEKEKTEA
jgi:hypothetical protein